MADYRTSEAGILDAGRALAAALETHDEFEIEIAAEELRAVGQAREDSAGTVSGFRGTGTDEAEPDPDAELEQILSELGVAQTLLSAGAAVDEGDPQVAGSGAVALSDALDQLDADRRLRSTGLPVTESFAGSTAASPPKDTFRGVLDGFLEDVVSRTTSVTAEAMKGLVALPLATVQPWVTSAAHTLGEIPAVGALGRLGMRALLRAVNALRQLVPQALQEKLAAFVKEWWDDSGAPGLTGRILQVGEVRQHADTVLAGSPDDARMREAADAVAALSARHLKTTTTMKRILVVLGAAVGPLAVGFAAAAGWLYGIAAAGAVAAVTGAFWVGRDCLDTGAGWERLDGVQVILRGLS